MFFAWQGDAYVLITALAPVLGLVFRAVLFGKNTRRFASEAESENRWLIENRSLLDNRTVAGLRGRRPGLVRRILRLIR